MDPPQKPPIALLYWEDVPNSPHHAVGQEQYDTCIIKVLTQAQFQRHEDTLRAIAAEVKAQCPSGFTDIEWHKTRWTKEALLEARFVEEARPTILAVEDDAGRYAIQYMYWPMDREVEPMRDLGALVLDKEGALLKTNIKGQCVVSERGNKSMNRGSIMLMYGSHAFRGDGEQHHLPAVYEPSGRVDRQVNAAVVR